MEVNAKGSKQFGITDLPSIVNKEKDVLNVHRYIRGLEMFIENCPTPMSIALQGDWGTGKTTFLQSMQQDFENEKKGEIRTVYFNTWQYSQFNMESSLYTSFLTNIMNQIVPEDSQSKDLLEKAGKILKDVWKISKSAAWHFMEEQAKKRIGITISDQLAEEGIKAEREQADAICKLKDNFKAIVADAVKEFPKGEGRIVIFVDDLDRLNPERAVEMLEVLKLFMDVENCVYVLAIDYDVVVDGVRQKYGSTMSDEKCRSFFDKIIQLPFCMPVSSYQINKLLTENLGMDLEGCVSEVSELIEQTLGTNPRTFKRLVNSYYLLETVEQAAQKEEVVGNEKVRSNLQHALLLSSLIMQMYSQETYAKLIDCKEGMELNALLNPSKKENSDQENNSEAIKTNLDFGLVKLNVTLDKLKKRLAGESKESVEDLFLSELHLSSITSISNVQERSEKSGEFTIVVNGEQSSYKSATSAFVEIMSQLLKKIDDCKIEKVLQAEEFKNYITTEPVTDKKSYFRATKGTGVMLGGKEILLGCSTDTPSKVRQVKNVMKVLGLPSDSVQWFKGEIDLLG
jgi:hypothetical protein